MKRTLTAIVAAAGAAGVAAGPALATSGIDWQDASKTEQATVQGLVIGVDEATDTFTIDADKGAVYVNVEQLANNPLDDQGRVQIEEGDNVSAKGLMGRDMADQWVLEASNVTRLVDDTDATAQ